MTPQEADRWIKTRIKLNINMHFLLFNHLFISINHYSIIFKIIKYFTFSLFIINQFYLWHFKFKLMNNLLKLAESNN